MRLCAFLVLSIVALVGVGCIPFNVPCDQGNPTNRELCEGELGSIGFSVTTTGGQIDCGDVRGCTAAVPLAPVVTVTATSLGGGIAQLLTMNPVGAPALSFDQLPSLPAILEPGQHVDILANVTTPTFDQVLTFVDDTPQEQHTLTIRFQ